MPLRKLTLLVLLLAAGPAIFAWAQTRQAARARPPVFNPAQTSNIFYDDIFTEALQGERPAPGTSAAANPAAIATPAGGANTPAATGGGAWDSLISATTIEDEVKANKLKVDRDVTTPTQFASRGYKMCRKHFSMLAFMFAITSEYSGDVRWKSDAPGARDAFARSARNCKTGTTQAYNEAKTRKQDLQDLLNGSGFAGKPDNPNPDWGNTADRSPLMQRLTTAFDESVKPMTASESEFNGKLDDILREAEIIAAIGHVLQHAEMPDGEDDDYKSYCEQMKQGAQQVVEAVKSKNYAQAASGAGAISKSCTECHELYRG